MRHTGPRRSPLRGRMVVRGGLWLQAGLVFAAAIAYFAVRGVTRSDYEVASYNAKLLVSAQQRLAIDVETAFQAAIIEHDWVINLANWIYIYGHWPLIAVVLTTLYVRARPEFRLLRNAMFISGAIGLVIFALFPVAPPRLGILEMVDTVSERSVSYRALQPPSLTNPYAALPSLHFGWNLLLGIALWRTWRSPWVRSLAVIVPVLMAFAVVATANHFVIDVVAGAVVALSGLLIARQMGETASVPAGVR